MRPSGCKSWNKNFWAINVFVQLIFDHYKCYVLCLILDYRTNWKCYTTTQTNTWFSTCFNSLMGVPLEATSFNCSLAYFSARYCVYDTLNKNCIKSDVMIYKRAFLPILFTVFSWESKPMAVASFLNSSAPRVNTIAEYVVLPNRQHSFVCWQPSCFASTLEVVANLMLINLTLQWAAACFGVIAACVKIAAYL